MKLDRIDYSKLIEIGFIRQDLDDDVLFRVTGYYGFALEMEFDLIDVGISTGCYVSNKRKEWDFKLYQVSTGDVIRKVELIELKNLIELFRINSEQVEQAYKEVDKIKK